MKELRPGDQPSPKPTQPLSVQDVVLADLTQHYMDIVSSDLAPADFSSLCSEIRQRKANGIERYGTVLLPFNGRVAIQDALEELLDGAFYLKQEIMEYSTALGDELSTVRERQDSRERQERMYKLVQTYKGLLNAILTLRSIHRAEVLSAPRLATK